MTARTISTGLVPETAAMIDANLELSRRFFAAAFDDPSLLDDLPRDAALILIPFDDPHLARANLAAAEREADLGKRVVLWIVGTPTADRPEWEAAQIRQREFRLLRPRWPANADETRLLLHYYQDTDALIIRFFDDDRTGLPVPWQNPSLLLVDPGSHEVLGYLLPRFLGGIIEQAPHLREWLRQAVVHDRTPDDVRLLVSDVAREPRPEPTVAGVRQEIGDVKLAG